jgi:magnesium-transporting ATPase (P-type)
MVVLIFETVLNIFALLSIIDIASSRGIYPQLVVTFFFRIAVCLLSMSNLLMGFYFLEVFSDQISSQDSFLRVYKIPFLTITFIVILVNFIMGILASEYIININHNNLINGIFLVILNIFALIILIVVLVKCYSITNVEGYLKKIRSVVFNFVIVCIIISLAILVLQFFFGTDIYYNTYHIRILSQFALALLVALSSFKIYKLVLVHTLKKKFTSKSKSTVSKNKKSEQKGEENGEEKEEKKEKKKEKKEQK